MASNIYGFVINVSGNAVQSVTAINNSLQHLNNSANQANRNTTSLTQSLIKAWAFFGGVGMITGAAKAIYTFGVEMEQTNIAFEVMLGNADRGRQMVSDLKKWADVTPFNVKESFDAGRMLLNYGVAAENIIPYMNMLGAASGGVGERFERMTYAFSQIHAAGRLMGQDLRQLTEAGFNPLSELAKKSGKSIGYFQDQMRKGEIPFAMVIDAFKSATGEGGRFFGMMQKQSQSVGGLWSTAWGNIQTGMFGMFQQASPLLKDFARVSSDIATSFSSWITPHQSELMSAQNAEMNSMFEILKKSNIPLDIRRNIIEQLNTTYTDYLPKLVTEKDTIGIISEKQNVANLNSLEAIRIKAQEEYISGEYKKIGKYQQKAVEAERLGEKAKYGDLTWVEKVKLQGFWGQNDFQENGWQHNPSSEEYQKMAGKVSKNYFDKAQKVMTGIKLRDDLKALQNNFNNSNNSPFNAVSAPKNFDLNVLKTTGVSGLGTSSRDVKSLLGTTIPVSPYQALENDASSTNKYTRSGGGLGEAKTITINIDKVMDINAQNFDGKDLRENAEKTVDFLIESINNLSYGQGRM